MLCAEFVDVAPLADHLDAEELHAIVQASHTTCTEVIHGFEGYIAHYLSDGLVAYFATRRRMKTMFSGAFVPAAHGPNAQNRQTASAERPRTVRIGIHTGPVVVPPRWWPARPARGLETLSIAAQLKALAAPGMVVISATTARLVEGYFLWQEKMVPLPG